MDAAPTEAPLCRFLARGLIPPPAGRTRARPPARLPARPPARLARPGWCAFAARRTRCALDSRSHGRRKRETNTTAGGSLCLTAHSFGRPQCVCVCVCVPKETLGSLQSGAAPVAIDCTLMESAMNCSTNFTLQLRRETWPAGGHAERPNSGKFSTNDGRQDDRLQRAAIRPTRHQVN